MPVKRVQVYQCECVMCSRTWNSRKLEIPARCPFCKSRKWNEALDEQIVKRSFQIAAKFAPSEPVRETTYEKMDW